MSSKNTMTRDAMLFLPAKVVEGLLVIGCSSLYSHIFVEGAVSAFNLTNTTIQLLYLILAGWMANSATRYVGEEYRADEGRGLFSTVSTIYVGLCVLVAIGCCITAAVTQSPVYLGGALMFCTYTAFQVLNAALIQLGRVKASILWSLTSAVLKLAVAFALVGGKSNYPSPFPAIFANTIADGVATIGAVFALSLPVVVRLKYFSKPLLNRFLKYGVPLMGVSISVALLNQIDKYLVVGFYGNILYAYYSNNNSIASGLFTMISVGIMRGVYPAVLRGWREGGKAAAKPLLDQGVRLYLLIAVPAVAGLTAVALPLSRFLFPAKYAAGAPVIAYTALAMLFMGLTEYANKAYEAGAVHRTRSAEQRDRSSYQGGFECHSAQNPWIYGRCARFGGRICVLLYHYLCARAQPIPVPCGTDQSGAHHRFGAAVRRGGLCVHAAAGRQSHSPWRGCRGRCRRLCGVHYRQR